MNKFKFFLIGVLLIGFSLEIGNLKFGVGIVHAQVPSNTKISCENTDPDEFHSLRPYQANTECTSQTAKEATFCGNSLTLKETITKTYPGGGGNCTTKGNKVYCTYNASVPSHSISIDLGSAELPFMGNTEDVVNYKNTTDTPTLTDADKMNDYVSWYLGGVTNKKEYPEKTDEKSVVNYSGPLAKLLPLEIQYASRSSQVNQAKKTRHDQIVVCNEKIIDSNLIFPPFKWALEKLGIGQTVPTDCSGGTKMRLTDWEGDISILRNIGNAGISLLDLFAKALPGIAGDVIEGAINDNKAWESRIPPLSWGTDPNGDPFNELTYRKAYNEWRGKSCIIIPVIKQLVCLENYLVPNSYAEMFSYIPMSSTEDVEGEIKIDNVSASSTVKDIKFSGQAAKLFFPHLEESDQLGSLLQDTYTPRGGEKVGNPTNVASGTSCNTVEVRSNSGDDLFADKITGNLSYTASFSCTFDAPVPTGCYDRCIYFGGVPNECRADCLYPDTVPPVATPTQTCSKDVYIELSTTSKIPMVDDIWSRLVAGPMAVFKRIFPKTNTEGSLGQIIDIPGSTNITYSGSGITQSNTDLKIPHIGGISEYFLKGIQTALRPKGFGDAISFADNSPSQSGGQCKPGDNDTNKAIADASAKYGVPAKLLQAIFEIEGLDYIANPDGYVCSENSAHAAGVMQMTSSAYNLITCSNEKADDNLAACAENGKFSRCNIHDSFELAARLLLLKVGRWDSANCKAAGSFPDDKMTTYNAACNYYGSFNPDTLTINLAKGIPESQRRQDGNMNYCDIVCVKMGTCPPYP